MTAGTDLTANSTLFTDDILGAIDSFDAALGLANDYVKEHGGALESAADYGTGFTVLEDKNRLVGVPFIVLQWRFNEGDYGDEGFVSLEIVTKNNEKFVVNDGSTGILRLMKNVTAQRIKAGLPNTHGLLACPTGLTASDFYYNEDTRETRTKKPDDGSKAWKPARTYYIAS